MNGLEQLHQLQADDGRQSRNRSSIINPIGFPAAHEERLEGYTTKEEGVVALQHR